MDSDPLAGLIWQDLMDEAVAVMTDKEKEVAVLRAIGLTDGEIALVLDIGRSAAAARMSKAHRRISRQVPELARFLAGRKRQGGRRRRRRRRSDADDLRPPEQAGEGPCRP